MTKFQHNNPSVLESNMSQEARDMEQFPVLIGDEVSYFHSVDGGYNRSMDCNVLNFIHKVQGIGSPNRIDPNQASHEVEAHLSDNYYNLNVTAVSVVDDYPDRDFVVSLKVNGYRNGKDSFAEPLSTDVDKRETRYE